MQATKAATIMIVEDEAAVRQVLALSLEGHDFETLAAGHLTEALALLKSNSVDLLLLDLRLGNESGIDLVKIVRCMPGYEKLPIVLLTGCADRNVVLQVAQLGVQGYVLKHQFSRNDLVSRIESLLKERSSGDRPRGEQRSAVTKQTDIPSTGRFEGEHLFSGQLGILKPLLARAQVVEQIQRRPTSSSFALAVGDMLRSTADAPNANDQIVSVIRSFRAFESRKHFSRELFWQHSIATGLIASQIARLGGGNVEVVNLSFTCGFLHDVAQMVLVEQLDDIYDRVLETAAQFRLPLEQTEFQMLQADHAELAAFALNVENLPSQLAEIIAAHHLPVESILGLPADIMRPAATLALADRLAHGLLLGFGGNNCHSPTEKLAHALEVTADAFDSIEQCVPAKTEELMAVAFRWGAGVPGAEYRERLMRKFRKQLRPMYVSANPATDAYRLLLRQLAAANHNRPPNIAVLYLPKPSQADALFRNLRERESAALVHSLPLILISPLPTSEIDPSHFSERDVRRLPAPFSLFQLADEANSLLTCAEE